MFQVLGNAALASEISNEEYKLFNGNTVVILGENFYSDQIVTIKKSSESWNIQLYEQGGMPMTVPVINGEFGE